MKKKLFSILLSLAMVVTMMPAMTMTAFAGEVSWTGSGTEEAPYQIGTLDDLNKLATEVNGGKDMTGKYFKLTAHIGDATTPFTTPIGNDTKQFKGNFDGDGHTVHLAISGLSYLGLFGCLNSGSIKNVTTAGTVADTSTAAYGHGPVAGVCASNIGGTIENCVNKAAVSCKNYGKYMGGICGKNEGGTINGCSNTAQVKAWGINAKYFGGICGQNYTGSILNCVNSGEVKALEYAINGMGGICGLNGGVDTGTSEAMTADAIIANCVNNGNVTVQGYNSNGVNEIGGICGRNNAGTTYKSMIVNCFSTAVMSYTSTKPVISCCGGVVGYNWENKDNGYYDTTVTNKLTSVAVGSTNFQHVTDTLGMTSAQMKTAAGSTYTGEGSVSGGKALVDLLNGYEDGGGYPEGWKEWVVKTDKYPSFKKESQPSVTVNMYGYTYGATPSAPSLSADVKDKATVTYYYSTADARSGGTEWKGITETTLNAGDYYMYAVIGETDNYDEYTTATTKFTVAKADQTAPEEGKGYSLDKANLNITIQDGYEVSASNEFTSTIDSGTALTNGTTYYIRKKATDNYNASPATSFVANKTYSITYKDQGNVEFTGEHETGYPTEHTYGTATILKKATKTGYTFGGWFTNKMCLGRAVKKLEEKKYSDNITLYAKWIANKYKVSFDKNGGDKVSFGSKKVTYDQKYGKLPTASRIGYTFEGWFTKAKGGDKVTSNTTVKITKNQTLYAHWKAIDYKINVKEPENGSVDIFGHKPYIGHYKDTVTFRVTPASGYRVSKVQVRDRHGKYVNVKYVGAGLYTFTMPASDVYVKAEFESKLVFNATPNDKSDEEFLKSEAARLLAEIVEKGSAAGVEFTEEEFAKIKAAYENSNITDIDVELNVTVDKAKSVREAVTKAIKSGERQQANYDVNVEMVVKTVERHRSRSVENTYTAAVTELSQTIKINLETGVELNGNVRVLHDHSGVVDEAKIISLDKSKGNVSVSISKFSTLTVVDEMPVGVATGDNNNIYLYMMLGLAAAIAAASMVARRRKEN